MCYSAITSKGTRRVLEVGKHNGHCAQNFRTHPLIINRAHLRPHAMWYER